jgi:hypothetical protein
MNLLKHEACICCNCYPQNNNDENLKTKQSTSLACKTQRLPACTNY